MQNTKNTSVISKAIQQFQLIEGVFTPEDAADVLVTMINKKISYHNGVIFSTWERFGRACPQSEARLTQLRSLRAELQVYINEANDAGKMLDINCKINIQTTEESAGC